MDKTFTTALSGRHGSEDERQVSSENSSVVSSFAGQEAVSE